MEYEVRTTGLFLTWLGGLTDTIAQEAIFARITRLRRGLFGDRRSVGDRVSELRVDVGQGYRLYYTMRGRAIILLVCGGGKKTQKEDIRRAEEMVRAMNKDRKGPAPGRVRERQLAYDADGNDEDEFHFTEDELKVTAFDPADYLERDSSQIYLLRDAFSSGHPAYIADAIGAVARARGLSKLERETGIKRQTLNKSLSLKGNPTLATLLTVLGALGLKLEVVEDGGGRPAGAPAVDN